MRSLLDDDRKIVAPAPHEEFPYTYVLRPQGKPGGLMLGTSPVSSLIKHGLIVMTDSVDEGWVLSDEGRTRAQAIPKDGT